MTAASVTLGRAANGDALGDVHGEGALDQLERTPPLTGSFDGLRVKPAARGCVPPPRDSTASPPDSIASPGDSTAAAPDSTLV